MYSVRDMGAIKQDMLASRGYEKKVPLGTSLMVQWLKLHAANVGGMGFIPDG